MVKTSLQQYKRAWKNRGARGSAQALMTERRIAEHCPQQKEEIARGIGNELERISE